MEHTLHDHRKDAVVSEHRKRRRKRREEKKNVEVFPEPSPQNSNIEVDTIETDRIFQPNPPTPPIQPPSDKLNSFQIQLQKHSFLFEELEKLLVVAKSAENHAER